jgi:hypothetical protein
MSTAPETPGETPERPEDTSPSLTQASSSSAQSKLSSNKWLLIGGGTGAAVVVAIIVAVVVVQVLGGGGPLGNSDLMKLAPENAEGIWTADTKFLRQDLDFEEAADLTSPAEEIDIADVDEYTIVYLEPGRRFYLLKGPFLFDDLRDDLEGKGYEEDAYRGYEVWSGVKTYAMLEDDGLLIVSDQQSATEEALKTLYRGSESLADAEDNDLKRILGKLGNAPIVFATVGDQCQVKRCRGWGQATTGYDIDKEELIAEVVLLFSSERAAESAADDYDEVKDFAEGRTGYDTDLADITSDGEFVLGGATVSSAAKSAPTPKAPVPQRPMLVTVAPPTPKAPVPQRPMLVTVAPPSARSAQDLESLSTLDIARALVDCGMNKLHDEMMMEVFVGGGQEKTARRFAEVYSREELITDFYELEC